MLEDLSHDTLLVVPVDLGLSLLLSLDCVELVLVVLLEDRVIEDVLVLLDVDFSETILVQLQKRMNDESKKYNIYLSYKSSKGCSRKVFFQNQLFELIHRIDNEVVPPIG